VHHTIAFNMRSDHVIPSFMNWMVRWEDLQFNQQCVAERMGSELDGEVGRPSMFGRNL
jgi:hypothetical protein